MGALNSLEHCLLAAADQLDSKIAPLCLTKTAAEGTSSVQAEQLTAAQVKEMQDAIKQARAKHLILWAKAVSDFLARQVNRYADVRRNQISLGRNELPSALDLCKVKQEVRIVTLEGFDDTQANVVNLAG